MSSHPHTPRTRYRTLVDALPGIHLHPMIAMRRSIGEGLGRREIGRDVIAGLVVAVVALPLSMALAIALNVRPEAGIYSAVIAGFLAALLGGSKVQITGPTAALVVVLSPIAAKFGLAGLAIVTIFAGLWLVLMGVLRFGRLIEFIPYPVTTGFTAGIGVVIATLQIKDFLGLKIDQMPFHYTERVRALWSGAREKFGSGDFSLGNLSEVLVGIGTLLMLVLWPRWNRKVPPALIAMPLAAIVVWACNTHVPGFHADTIRSRFATAEVPHGVSASLPTPVLPWNEPGPRDAAGNTHPLQWPWSPKPAPADAVKMDTDAVRTLLTTSLVVAMLGAIATLLSAVVADGLIAKRHDPDAELAAQGIGNIVSPFFGGFASTGAIARTLVNVRAGGRSPIAGMTHALVLMGALLITAPLMGHMPMAAMAALLLSVARNMVEPRHFVFLLRYAPKSDAVVLIVCFVLTVIFDMALAVGAGVSLAAILFMRRMAEVSNIRLVGNEHPALKVPVPEGLVIYDVGGPLFFGAAQRALGAVADVGTGVRVVILDLTDVPTLDATAMVTLDSVMSRLSQRKVFVVLAGVHDSVLTTMHRAGWDERGGNLAVAGDLETGIEIARAYVEG